MYSASELIKMVVDRKVTSAEATTAFCKRAVIAQQSKFFFDKALERAKQCDEYLARERHPMGVFHGSPISLKICDSPVGRNDSYLCSLSDIAGSIRVPALPTVDCIPWVGQQVLLPKGWSGTLPTLGPLPVSAPDLILFTKTVLDARQWGIDSKALAVPFRDVLRKVKLRIGVYLGDNMVPLHPPIKRALRTAVDKLRTLVHELIELEKVPSLLDGAKAIQRGSALDTEHSVLKVLEERGQAPIKPLIEAAKENFVKKADEFDLGDVWQLNSEREDYREAWSKVWKENSLDVVLAPASKGIGALHDHFGLPHYTGIWNLLGSGNLPGIWLEVAAKSSVPSERHFFPGG